MVKKLIVSILAVLIFTAGTTAFAESFKIAAAGAPARMAVRNPVRPGVQNPARPGAQNPARPGAQSIKDKASEVKPLLDRINSNSIQIESLRSKANTAYKNAKNKIKKLLGKKDDLTQEQVALLKDAAVTLDQDGQILAETAGEIEKQSDDLKAAKDSKDLESYKSALNNIINIQKTRIDSLKKVISDLTAITRI